MCDVASVIWVGSRGLLLERSSVVYLKSGAAQLSCAYTPLLKHPPYIHSPPTMRNLLVVHVWLRPFWAKSIFGQSIFGPKLVFYKCGAEGWGLRRCAPNGEPTRKSGAPEGVGPEGWGAQNFALFSLSRHNFLSFFFLLGVFSWNSSGFSEGRTL